MYTSTSCEAREWEITESQARAELRRHSCIWEEFLADVGTFDGTGAQVLDWLGY